MELKISYDELGFGNSKEKGAQRDINFNTELLKNISFREYERVKLFVDGREFFANVRLKGYKNSEKKYYMCNRLKEEIEGSGLEFSDKSEIRIEKIYGEDENFFKVKPIKAEQLLSKNIKISKKFLRECQDAPDFAGILFVNEFSGHKIFIEKEKLIARQEEDKENIINLSQRYRLLLESDLPSFICQYYLDKFPELKDIYSDSEYNLEYKCSYFEKKNEFKKLLDSAEESRGPAKNIRAYPIYGDKVEDSMRDKILKGLIGSRTNKFIAIRPISGDEGEDIIRLSKSSMEILGLEESDLAKITYIDKSYRARVFEFCDLDEVDYNNRTSIKNIGIVSAIPSHIRHELGLDFLGTSVSIKRDEYFLLKKNMNNLALSIFGFLISIPAIFQIDSIVLRVLAFVVLALILFYISLSEVRSKVFNNE